MLDSVVWDWHVRRAVRARISIMPVRTFVAPWRRPHQPLLAIDQLIFIPDLTTPSQESLVGGKAHNLALMVAGGFAVPPFFILTAAAYRSAQRSSDPHGVELAPELLAALDAALERTGLRDAMLAVRSSAVGEDGAELSYAGQLESRLFVRRDGLAEAIADVWRSASAERVRHYRSSHELDEGFAGVGVIVQKMIDADVSGVAFGIDPIGGDREAVVVSAVPGLGEGLVSGELDADAFVVRGAAIERRIAAKRDRIVFDRASGSGTLREPLPESMRDASSLSDDELARVVEVTRALGRYYGRPQDVEWCFADGQLYLLQSRPVTGLRWLPPDRRGGRILWDNSNIIESYSGVTTPLTFSFVSDVYTVVYQEFCRILGVDEETIDRNAATFRMLGMIEGRIYYNLLNWYRMLALLPGYRINAAFMEQMMGVSERLEETPAIVASTRNPWLRLGGSIYRLVTNLITLPRQIVDFQSHLDATLAPYENRDLGHLWPHELVATYRLLERELLRRWRVPILNDFYTMIFFGALKKSVEKLHLDGAPTLHNDLLSGEGDIVSTEPPRRLQQIADAIRARDGLAASILREEPARALEIIETHPEIDALVRAYLDRFGNRYPGELRLETVTPAERPELLVEQIATILRQTAAQTTADRAGSDSAATANAASDSVRAGRDGAIRVTSDDTRRNAERTVERAMRGPFRRLVYQYVLAQARTRVRNRENLRFERTRVFAVVRSIFLSIGGRLFAEGILDDRRDIFFLTKEELFSWIDGTSVTTDLRALVALRRAEHERHLAARPDDRFETWGMVYQGNTFRSTKAPDAVDDEGVLRGTPCSAGVVRAIVRVVRDPATAPSLDGAILVAERTDPGWVPLFAAASGLLVERGSLLSHSAIVAREMGIPAIVAIPGLMERLVDGELVEMDGATGIVRRIPRQTSDPSS
jgi:rifampicin phosphotransferase